MCFIFLFYDVFYFAMHFNLMKCLFNDVFYLI